MNGGIDGSNELREVLASRRVDPLLYVRSIEDVPKRSDESAHFYAKNLLCLAKSSCMHSFAQFEVSK